MADRINEMDRGFFNEVSKGIDMIAPLALQKYKMDQTRDLFEQKMNLESQKLATGLQMLSDKLETQKVIADLKLSGSLEQLATREEGRDRRLTERLDRMDTNAEESRQLRRELEAMRTERKKIAPGTSGGSKGKNITLYGPGGKSKSIFVPQGESYEPEEGWTLTKPGASKTSLRDALGGGGGSHPLTGKAAGKYKVGNRVVAWDGTKELD